MFELTQQQKKVLEQIKVFMESDATIFILRGYAGTGKTTMIKAIADLLYEGFLEENKYLKLLSPTDNINCNIANFPKELEEKLNLKLVAPTGRAARILKEKTGFKASTIHVAIYSHMFINYKQKTTDEINNPTLTSDKVNEISDVKNIEDIADLEFKLVFPIKQPEYQEGCFVAIVDEASMVSSQTIPQELFQCGTDNLMNDLLTFVRPNYGGKIIFVGDPAQLPPVGDSKSNALNRDYFQKFGHKVMEAELTEVLRQQGGNAILQNAMKIRDLLKTNLRNEFNFEEHFGEVQAIPNDDFLLKYFEYMRETRCIMIGYSNLVVSKYNELIREHIYCKPNAPLQAGDLLLITQNNYNLGLMNGDFVKILKVEDRISQSAPVWVQEGGKKVRKQITLDFRQIIIPDENNKLISCLLIEKLLTSEKSFLSIDEYRALFINFCMRHPKLRRDSIDFKEALRQDPFMNAISAKYGYAVTGHKCQGGEWDTAFVDFAGRTGLNDDCLRWAYTATTRAKNTLYITNMPHITPFENFRIDPIQLCKKIDGECRIIPEVEPTPFHNANKSNFLRAKYHCIMENMSDHPFSIAMVQSMQYKERYSIQMPDGTIADFDLNYDGGGLFKPAVALLPNNYTEQVTMLLNDERSMPMKFAYQPSDDLRKKLYSLIHSACDTLSIPLTNIVEKPDYSINFYFRTSNTFSYIKIYVNKGGFITYAKPMSLLGEKDSELKALINEIKNRF